MAAVCERCGRGRMSWWSGAVKFKDKKYICVKCLKELGRSPYSEAAYLRNLVSDEVLRPDEYSQEKAAAHEEWKKNNPEMMKFLDSLDEENTQERRAAGAALGVVVSNYGQERDLVCTEEEREIFDIIRSLCDDYNLDSEVLELVRKSDDYVSVIMRSSSGYGLMDVARVKYTNRAKWIKICPEFERIELRTPEDAAKYAQDYQRAYIFNQKYL